MTLRTESYLEQVARWPKQGKHILAHFDDTSVVVYQAYRPAIGHFAATHGSFGGEFSLTRMSWIKPNFLWMMFRAGWGMKEGQETILAVRIKRSAFDTLLEQAVHSTYTAEVYASEAEWKDALTRSEVRLQWDPDHDPSGARVERRALQLGLRGQVLAHYAHDWILDLEDITEYVHHQHGYAQSHAYQQLVLPQETVYPVTTESVIRRLGLSVDLADGARTDG
jgi:hypothetical protein